MTLHVRHPSYGALHFGALRYRFPWRNGNEASLLVDGGQFFPAMLRAIEEARRYVLLEMYLIESGEVANRFIDAITAAAQRGVTVCVLLDDLGARGLGRADRDRLLRGGCALAFHNPLRISKWLRNMARDHRKLLLVDGMTAFTGGVGITDAFDPPGHPEQRWRETVVCVHGPVVADWQVLFSESWSRCARASLDLPDVTYSPEPAGVMGCVGVSSGYTEQGYQRMLLKNIRAAHTRIWLCTAYFVPSLKIRRALRAAARRGVDVRLLLPSPHTDHPAVRHAGRRFYTALLRHGVRIFEYQDRVLHAKTALCDEWVAIGSSNIDRWTLRWNLEANQVVEGSGFASRVTAMLAADFGHSEEVHYKGWMRRGRWARFKEYFWGGVDRWLHRLGRG